MTDEDKGLMKKILKVAAIVVALIILFASFGTVKAGQVGVKVRVGKIVGMIQPGLYFKIPFVESVNKMDVKTRTINYDKNGNEGDTHDSSQLLGASKDLQDVSIGVVVNYHINPAKADVIYSQYNSIENFESSVVESIIRKTVKSLSAQYTAEELVTKRSEYNDNVTKQLSEELQAKDVIVEQSNITNFEFSKSFTAAIEAKVTATQNAEAAKNKLEQVKFEAQQKIETAKADAEAIRIQAQAVTSQGGEDYVRLQALKVWDGHGCTQNCFGQGTQMPVPFFNIK